jgi:hypothetical protein
MEMLTEKLVSQVALADFLTELVVMTIAAMVAVVPFFDNYPYSALAF